MMLRKQKVLAGEVPSSIPAATPCKVLYSVSLNTTRQMKNDLPEQLVRGAHQAY